MRTVLPVGSCVVVEVPATSANLGPGFDCFGLAFDWRESVQLAVIERGFQVEVTGEGAAELARDESHLIIRSALTGLADLGVEAPGLRLSCRNTIPHGRGLGSSSAATVAGLAAAAGLAGRELDPTWLLRHANAIEGHPDNVAAAIYGGFVLAYEGHQGVAVAQASVHPTIQAAVYIADQPVGTNAARRLLPEQVPHVDAAADAGRAALLVHAMAADPTKLFEGTQDWLHQQYRSAAMPRSYELVTALRGEGRAAFISGAGPSVAVLGTADLDELDGRSVSGFHLRRVGVGRAASVLA
jgi:homoserine kinase